MEKFTPRKAGKGRKRKQSWKLIARKCGLGIFQSVYALLNDTEKMLLVPSLGPVRFIGLLMTCSFPGSWKLRY